MELIAGPCSFETDDMTSKTIQALTSRGVVFIRGGMQKYRSDSATYQGNWKVMDWVKKYKEKYTFKWVVEVFDIHEAEILNDIADVWQVGSRNMYNTNLLKALGFYPKPTILKRHFAASLDELLKHAEYLKYSPEIILGLRGIQSMFPQDIRFFPDVTDIPRLREKIQDKNYKICYDVSHSACQAQYVQGLFKCAQVYDPDYIMIEVHPSPSTALSDPQQQLNFTAFEKDILPLL